MTLPNGKSGSKFALVLAVVCIVAGVPGCLRATVQDDLLDFALRDLDGNRVSLSDERFEGKVVLVELWGTWCPPCLVQMPYLIRWQETYRDRGFEIVALEFAAFLTASKKEYEKSLKKSLEAAGVNYTVIQAGETTDVGDVLPQLRNFQGFPTSIFIGRDGLVKHMKSGFHESEVSYYEKTIEGLLEGTAASVN